MISFETYFDESAKQWVIRWSKGEDSVCGYGATLDDALVDFKHSVSSVVNNVEQGYVGGAPWVCFKSEQEV